MERDQDIVCRGAHVAGELGSKLRVKSAWSQLPEVCFRGYFTSESRALRRRCKASSVWLELH